MLTLRQKKDFIGNASGSKMKRPQEAFCYQIPLTLPVVTFIRAEGMLPKSDFTSESARIRCWSCNRRKTVGRRQTFRLWPGRREEAGGERKWFCVASQTFSKVARQVGEMGPAQLTRSTFSNNLFSHHFSCHVGKWEKFPPNHCKVCPVFPGSSLLFFKVAKNLQPNSSWAGSTILPASWRWTTLTLFCPIFTPVIMWRNFQNKGPFFAFVWQACRAVRILKSIFVRSHNSEANNICMTIIQANRYRTDKKALLPPPSWVLRADPSEYLVFQAQMLTIISKISWLSDLHLGFAQKEHPSLLIISGNCTLLCWFISFPWLCNGNKTAYSTMISQKYFQCLQQKLFVYKALLILWNDEKSTCASCYHINVCPWAPLYLIGLPN